MVIDTSAIIAILLVEPEMNIFVEILAANPPLAISAATFHEASVVMAGKAKNAGVAAIR